jgi:hypothetical protein
LIATCRERKLMRGGDEMKAKILLLIGLLALAGCSASADANKHGAGASVGVGDEQATGSVRR